MYCKEGKKKITNKATVYIHCDNNQENITIINSKTISGWNKKNRSWFANLLLVLAILLNNLCCFANEKGLGIEAIRKGGIENIFAPLQIKSIQPNSPAEKAKIVQNWYIISINGELTKDLTDQNCLSLLNNNERIELYISPTKNIYNQNAVKLTLNNEEGFSNIIKYIPIKKGIGLGIYKYDLDLKMPLIISSVEKSSPAELAGIQKNTFILKINNKSTKELTVAECDKLLNSKKLELEVTDLQNNNVKNYKLNPQSYYANEVKKPEKGWILSKAIVVFSQNNPKEKVLSEYFKTFNPNYDRSNGMTNQEIAEADFQKLQKPYLKFKANKNDMEFNKNLYDGINTFINQYKELNKWDIETVKKFLVYYGEVDNSASEKQVIDYITLAKIENSSYFINKIETRKHSINTWTAMTKDIKDYSVAYEMKQKQSIPKVTTPYFIDNVDFRELLWGWQTAKRPQINGLYIITPQTGAKVLQSVSGGVLLTTDVTRLSNPRTIFVATKRQFVDDEWLKDSMVIVFVGYYTYTNTLGVNRKIYKFKEVPQAEYWNRIKKNEYYFIK